MVKGMKKRLYGMNKISCRISQNVFVVSLSDRVVSSSLDYKKGRVDGFVKGAKHFEVTPKSWTILSCKASLNSILNRA